MKEELRQLDELLDAYKTLITKEKEKNILIGEIELAKEEVDRKYRQYMMKGRY